VKIVTLSSGFGWHVQDLVRAGNELDIEVEPVDFRSLRAMVGETRSVLGGGTELTNVDGVLIRTMPGGTLEQIVFRMDALHALLKLDVPVVNPPRALETAIDKYLSLCRLADAKLPVPETVVCESLETIGDAFEDLDRDVVVKPLFGSEGIGLVRCTDRHRLGAELATAVEEGRALYVQRYVESSGVDFRLLVVGDEVVASIRRSAPPGEWISNIARGAAATRHDADSVQRDLAVRAAHAVGAEIAGVDLIYDRDGRPFVLEVNAVPGWRSLSSVCDLDIARIVLEEMRRRVSS
jgi:ribosomal protein S6--L-glutamate ligase